jgi:hypothetical protein
MCNLLELVGISTLVRMQSESSSNNVSEYTTLKEKCYRLLPVCFFQISFRGVYGNLEKIVKFPVQ